MNTKGSHELRIAERIVGVLPPGSFMRVCSDERETIRYAVRSSELKLKSVVLGRASLQRLIADPDRPVKIEYLQRELSEAATHRGEFRFPRVVRRASSATMETSSLTPHATAS